MLGALDQCLGNRWGLGQAFNNGFMTMGSLALVMIGIVSLAPVLAAWLIPIVSPLYVAMGADPASFANTILAVDMGDTHLRQKWRTASKRACFHGFF